ncbi:DoxX family protein [Luteococcus sp. H138]|uniref:DoxX family protein n=1 Tax=unclassified Luteococcus TaxID=2639923 RepID=UPI00313EB64D
MHPTQTPYTENPLRAILLLACRVALGVIFFTHGWSKFTDPTIQATIKQFTTWGIPYPGISAPLVGALEVIGGACLVLGAYTWVVCVLLSLEMAGAIWFIHRHNGLLVGKGGWEYSAALIAGLISLSIASAGQFSYDAWANGDDSPKRRRTTRRR